MTLLHLGIYSYDLTAYLLLLTRSDVQNAFRIIAVVVYQITGNVFSALTMQFNKLFVMRCGRVRSLVQI